LAGGALLRKDELKPEDLLRPAGAVEPPEWLSSQAELAVWHEFADVLRSIGVLTIGDAETLAVLCSLTVQLRAALVEARTQGPTIDDGARVNPAIRAALELIARMRPLWAAFGLTPADRLHKAAAGGDSLDKLIQAESQIHRRNAEAG
jgi:P27 family predicted phage terminase small subunit